jgi:hypothetical protein
MEGVMWSAPKARMFLGVLALAALAPRAWAETQEECVETCHKEWWCYEGKDPGYGGRACNFARRHSHGAGHKGCTAKCWVLQKAGAAADSVKQTYQEVKQKAAETYDAAKEKAKETYDAAKEKAKETYDAAKEKAKETYDAAKNKVKQGYNYAKDKVKQGYDYAKDKVKQGYDYAKDKVKQGYDYAKDKVKQGYNYAKDKVKQGYNYGKDKVKEGYNYAKDKVKEGEKFLKDKLAAVTAFLDGLSCEKIVEMGAKFDPMNILLSKVPALQTCRVEMQKGFICKIPNLVKDLVTMLKGSLKGAWENKVLCGSVGLATMGAGLISCGLAMWAGPKLAKVAQCLNELRKTEGIVNALKAIFAPGTPDPSKPKWWGMMKFGCNFVGGILMDLVIAALTGGGSLAGSISGQIVKMLPQLAGKTSEWILQKAVGAGIATTQQLTRVVDRALPAACH